MILRIRFLDFYILVVAMYISSRHWDVFIIPMFVGVRWFSFRYKEYIITPIFDVIKDFNM